LYALSKQKYDHAKKLIAFIRINVSKELTTQLVNEKDRSGFTCLHFAANGGQLEIIKSLIEMGADIDCRNKKGWTVLHSAAFGDMPVAFYFFLQKQKHSNINEPDNSGNTPLHIAATYGCACITSIHAWGGEINSVNNDGNTPLHLLAIERPE
jgi:ankyrin repeat protein